ncbi:MAG: glycosyltransferase family 39 protein [Rudaea sp.]|uniref:glycosyltransferase family 39 protein n=1 Tax=Rudaea sp. TaxID=2136325 RepID=UPI0039E51AB5
MPTPRPPRASERDLWILVALAAAKLAFHVATDGQYGFHRDELQFLSDARRLDWGYVAYPPLTPFLGRVEWELFGASLAGFRFFPALAQSIVFVVAGLTARRLGGRGAAMLLAAFAVALAPVSLSGSALFMYVTFDYLWYVLLAYFVVCRIESGDARWWLAIGAMVGLGMMTKYTAAFFAAGLVAGVVLTPLRADLRSKWLWCGVALALLIFLPNLIWQYRHDFVTLDMLRQIHARDVRIGRADGFLGQQFYIATNPFSVPLWLLGLCSVFARGHGGRWRILGWMALVPLAIFVAAQGRGYYAAPLYPMLIAAGAIQLQILVERLRSMKWQRAAWIASFAIVLSGALALRVCLPLVPVNSPAWARVNELNGDFREQFGWPELAREVARIRDGLTAEERAQTGIWASNYGEAGALDLYGPQYGLPQAWSAANSFWLRGPYGRTPQNMIVVGSDGKKDLEQPCTTFELVGHTGNDAKVENEETKWHPDIFLCRGVRKPLAQLWPKLAEFM